MGIFRNFSISTTWVVRLLWIGILVDTIAVLSGLSELWLLSDIESGSYDYDLAAAANRNDLRQGAIGIIQLVLYVAQAVTILAWIRLANKNIRLLGAKDMEFTPGWAIGWYFIPIANLWKPYQAMSEIWRASSGSPDWKSDETSGSLPGWWFAWLVANVLGRLSFKLTMNAEELPELKNASIALTAADVAGIVLSLLFLEVVKEIYRRQTAWPAASALRAQDSAGLAAGDTV
ncbi:DUF4328 domain-containing protein [Mesorhizobium helmanticense]|uniref:DUF4328 domain-containing protein n=1 Tax=Mesorhizobium helmanticense TaxID=1776423 RepID=A0A2T4IVI4_9HYPH|nr:DUF4328 domain-containing protein [Mesorhizobium helmanticense]PTE09573.1 hypothetical protein C9427_15945 [Mesorhizobium helmanticense]